MSPAPIHNPLAYTVDGYDKSITIHIVMLLPGPLPAPFPTHFPMQHSMMHRTRNENAVQKKPIKQFWRL